MNSFDILQQRLHNQRLTGKLFSKPEDMVQHLCAMQSQDYYEAKWSVGQRVRNCTDNDVEQAFNAGRILRTHVLRPTWHFVHSADIRWMLQLTAPRVKALSAYQYRQHELDDKVFGQSRDLFVEALQGSKHLTRPELAAILGRAGIVADGLRLSLIMMNAELEGLVCSGPVRGKQHTYALLEERAPQTKALTIEEALAELTLRFFAGHGPATLGDYVRWSGLSVTQAKQGLETVKNDLQQEAIEGQTYWFSAGMELPDTKSMAAYLLPEYDECVLTYPDLNFPDLPWVKAADAWSDFFDRPIIINCQRAGTWRRTITKGTVVLETNLFTTLNSAQTQVLEAAVERYGIFMDMPVKLVEYA